MSAVIERAVSWAVAIANDGSHGYDQQYRWGPSYDCSSLVLSAYEQAGVPVRNAGGNVTGDVRRAFMKCGFRDIPYTQGMALIKGDILLNEKHHTALYIGDGKIVHASINEKGGTIGGIPGDQTGKEICIRSFYTPKYGWDYVLRYGQDEGGGVVSVNLRVCRKGSKCNEVGVIQTLLKAQGYKGKDGRYLEIDSDFGNSTAYAVSNFQNHEGIDADSIVGCNTWSKLLTTSYTP